MPKVPTLSGNRISAERGRVPQIQTQDFAGQRGAQQIQRAADQLNDLRIKIEDSEIKKANELALIDADKKLSEYENQTLYDPKSGAMNVRGKDSFDLPNSVLTDFDAKASEIEGELANDFQRMSFKKMVARRRGHVDKQVQRHVSRETRLYDDQVTKDYVANEMNAAIENFHDPDRIQLGLDRMKGAILSHADRNGMSKESTDRLLEETTSKTHKSVFSRILNSGGVTSAQQYFKKYKDGITGEDEIAMQKALKEGLIDRDSQLKSDDIYAKHSDDMTKALDKARKIRDPERRDETVRRVKARFADQKLAEQEESRQSFNAAYDILENNKGNLEAIPREAWSEMEPAKREKLKKIANNIKYGNDETDWNKFYDLKMMASNPATRKKFMRRNLKEDFADMADAEKKALINLQTKAINNQDDELDEIYTEQQTIKMVMASAGLVEDKDNKKTMAKINSLTREVEKRARAFQLKTGKKPTNDEIREITNHLMEEVIVNPGKDIPRYIDWFGFTASEKKPRYALEPGDKIYKKIPNDIYNKIRDGLKARGKEPTEELIMQVYTETVGAQ